LQARSQLVSWSLRAHHNHTMQFDLVALAAATWPSEPAALLLMAYGCVHRVVSPLGHRVLRS
jgi:hypothetical protein